MLDRIFIKNYEDINNAKVRNAYGILASTIGIVFNMLLSIAKIVVGVLFHSVAIFADGMNNLSDAGSSLVTMFGFRISNIPADKKHPFGHARMEYIASLIISFVVLFLSIEIIRASIVKLVEGNSTEANIIIMIVLGVSILVKFGMFLYYRMMSKKIDSKALKATSTDSLNDAIASLAVLISTLVVYFTKVDIDGYMGIAVAIYIFFSGAGLFKETVSPLLGEKPSAEFVNNIVSKIHAYDGVLGIHDLMVHNYGPNQYHVSVHVEVSAHADIMESHELIDTIERDFKAEGVDMVIHLDPIITDDERVNALKEMVEECLAMLDVRITYHDFRVVWGDGRKNLIFDIVIPFDTKYSDEEIVAKLEKLVKAKDAKCYLVVDVDRNYIGVE